MQPTEQKPRLVQALGSARQKLCAETDEVVIETWVPNGSQTKLLKVRNTLTISVETGCVGLRLESLGTGDEVPLCCEPVSCSGPVDDELVFREKCGIGIPVAPFDMRKSVYLEITSFDVSPTTIHDGDTVTFTAEWQLRDDYTASDTYKPPCCTADESEGCFDPKFIIGAGNFNGGAVFIPISSDIENPRCVRRGEVYHASATYRVVFTNTCLSPSIHASAFFGVGPACVLFGEPTWQLFCGMKMALSSQPLVTPSCEDGRPFIPPAMFASPCPDSSGGDPSGSDPGSSGSGGGGPSSKSSGPSVVDPGSGLGGGLGP